VKTKEEIEERESGSEIFLRLFQALPPELEELHRD
jgi:hypothetical protein